MSRVLAVANQKGGVAKTTTVLHLGVALAELGQRVLLVDLDPQGGLTLSCGFQPDALERSVYDALIKEVDSEEVMVRTSTGVDLLPANIDLALADIELVNMVARERRLAGVLAPLRDRYDFVILDCQPSLGLITVNALAVADEVLIPVACEFLSTRSLRALLKVVNRVRLRLNSRLRVSALIPTMFDSRTNHSREQVDALVAEFDRDIPVFEIPVRRSVRFPEAAERGQPIFQYAPKNPGAEAYRLLAERVLRRDFRSK